MQIGIQGRILTGEYQNWFILTEPVSPQSADQGPYYLFVGETDPRRGFDSWFETYDELAGAIEELGPIEWGIA